MKRSLWSLFLAAGFSLAATLPYQGLATDAKGKPVADGAYWVTFALYDSASGGPALWNEDQAANTAKGLFSVTLGKQKTIPDSLFDETPLYLGVTFDGRAQSGRQILGTTPWAKQADKAKASRSADSAARCRIADSANSVAGLMDSSSVLRTKIKEDSIAHEGHRRSDSAGWHSMFRADSGLIAAQAAKIANLEKALVHQSSILSKAIQAMQAPDRGVPWNPKIAYGFMADPRDGAVYRTVEILHRIWMAENLRYPGRDTALGVCASPVADSCIKYGRLYTWTETMTGQLPRNAVMAIGPQGICPAGWHVPSAYEWSEVMTFTNMNSDGTRFSLKSTSGWLDCATPPPTESEATRCLGTDEFGFRGLAAGRSRGGENLEVGRFGGWWHASTMGSDSLSASLSGFSPGNNGIGFHSSPRNTGISVRCVKD